MKLNPDYEVGDVVELQSAPGGSPLPVGAGVGLQVRVIAMGADFRVVEREGREWRVPASNIRPRRPGSASVPVPGRCRR